MLEISIEKVDTLLGKLDGNHSEVYHLIKDRLGDYDEQDIAFAGEFLFFEERYLKILKHLMENDIPVDRIIDVGCQFGFQSELFDGVDYIGIDVYKNHFFNTERKNVQYIVGLFPQVEVDLKNAVVISSMSLGYFNHMIDKDEEKALEKIIRRLSECARLYIATEPKLIQGLKNVFKRHEVIEEHEVGGHSFPMYYFEN